MATRTKLELEQINARLAAENAVLRKQVADLTLINEMQREPARRVAAHMPSWQVQRAEAMAAAREMAMRSGYSVKV